MATDYKRKKLPSRGVYVIVAAMQSTINLTTLLSLYITVTNVQHTECLCVVNDRTHA